MSQAGNSLLNIPRTTENRIVFPLQENMNSLFYSMAEFNPAHTEGVLTKYEIYDFLASVSQKPHFKYELPFSDFCVKLVVLLANLSLVFALIFWFALILGKASLTSAIVFSCIAVSFWGILFYIRHTIKTNEQLRNSEIEG